MIKIYLYQQIKRINNFLYHQKKNEETKVENEDQKRQTIIRKKQS